MRLRYYNLLLALLILGACNKVEVAAPEFEVEAVSTTVKVNQEVDFRFKGDPYQISFYSGDIGNDYAFKDGRILEPTGLEASFSTNVRYGNNPHPNLLSVWVSTDFNGKYNFDDVSAATWKDDITKNFKLAPENHTGTTVAQSVLSGIQDLSPHLEKGKPLYFAYKYKKTPTGGGQRNWFTYNTLIESTTILGKQTHARGQDFTLVYDHNYLEGDDPKKTSTVFPSGNMTIRAPDNFGNGDVVVWSISPPIIVDNVDMGPDKSVPIKGFADTRSSEYKHAYTKPGVYKATFIASNSSAYGGKSVVREIEITVTE